MNASTIVFSGARGGAEIHLDYFAISEAGIDAIESQSGLDPEGL